MSKCQPPWIAPLFNLDRDMRTRVLTNPSNDIKVHWYAQHRRITCQICHARSSCRRQNDHRISTSHNNTSDSTDSLCRENATVNVTWIPDKKCPIMQIFLDPSVISLNFDEFWENIRTMGWYMTACHSCVVIVMCLFLFFQVAQSAIVVSWNEKHKIDTLNLWQSRCN